MRRTLRVVGQPQHPQQPAASSSTEEGRAVPSDRPEHVTYNNVVRPLTYGREKASKLLDALLKARVEQGDYSASNCALAARLGVSEKWIRDRRDGTKSLPFEALLLLPDSVANELLNTIRADVESGGVPSPRTVDAHGRRLAAQLGRFSEDLDVALIDGELSAEERACLMRDLLELVRRVHEAISGLQERK